MKTFVIMGNFRGGTTAVAGMLIKAGVDWSKNTKEHLEDLEIQAAFQDDRIDDACKLIGIQCTVSTTYGNDSWGFKYPGAFLHIDKWLDKVSNPHLIFVFRDPVAVGWSEANRMGFDVKEMMERTNEYNTKMTEIISKSEVPCIAISYELLITRTRIVTKGLLKWAGIEADEYEVASFVNKRMQDGQEYDESKALL